MSQIFTEQEGRAWVQWRKKEGETWKALCLGNKRPLSIWVQPLRSAGDGHALVFQQVNGSSGSAYTGQSWQGADSLCPALNVCL